MSAKQRYFIELAYDGTRYHGWQVQDNAVSVQEQLNKSLSTILRQPIETTGCGRTDAGVHAKEFFAHFDVEASIVDSPWSMERSDVEKCIDDSPWSMEASDVEKSIEHRPWSIDKIAAQKSMDYGLSTMDKKLVRGLNALLPADIGVKRLIPVYPDAHARFDATLRSYAYHVHFDKDPFKTGYSWQLRDIPNIELMKQAAKIIMEYSDFSCFSKSNTQVKTYNCKISRAEWVDHDGGMVFHISADRFLRNMVRAIVGTLMLAGRGEMEPEGIRAIIESKNRSNAGASVPACGLYLTEVKYPYLL